MGTGPVQLQLIRYQAKTHVLNKRKQRHTEVINCSKTKKYVYIRLRQVGIKVTL